MTCIVGIVEDGNVLIGGDSAAISDDHTVQIRAEPKVFRNGPALIGFCASFRLGQLLRFGMSVPSMPPNDDPMAWMVGKVIPLIRTTMKDGGMSEIQDNVEALGGSFLMAAYGRLFQVEEDFHVGETIDGFDAVGGGANFALGSLVTTQGLPMAAEDRVRLALTAASHFCAGVRAPFHILRLEEKPEKRAK